MFYKPYLTKYENIFFEIFKSRDEFRIWVLNEIGVKDDLK